MAHLKSEHKRFVVQRLACFATPSEVQTELKGAFGVEASLPQLMFYDPGSAAGARELSQEWRDLFASTRERYIADTAGVASAHQRHRLEIADRRLRALLARGNMVSDDRVLKYLEYIERSLGGAYTNRRELTGKDGGPIETRDGGLDDLSTADLAALAAQLAKDAGAQGG